jgi:hypothetical protein
MHEMLFVSKDLVMIQVGRLSVSAYPKVEPRMPIFERAHAFQVTKNTLEALNTDTRLILEAMGAQLNCSTMVDGLIHDWCRLFDSTWFNFANLAIISFCNSVSMGINNTTVAGNPALLLLVINGPVATCCQQDVCFVCVTCTINFTSLVSMPNYGPMTLNVSFYLKLPQSTIVMVNGNNRAYNLTTWHGTANLTTLTSNKVRVQILEPTLQVGPIALCLANFNLGNANINTNAIRNTIHAKILELGFKQICRSIFTQLCPRYSDQPHAVLEHIRQTSTDPNGQPVTATVIEYYQRMMNAIQPFAMQNRYTISVCNCFINGLEKMLDVTSIPPSPEPICVAQKICGKKRLDVLLNNRGFPDQSHMFDVILHNVKGGPILCKQIHPMPALNDINPQFATTYDKTVHGARLRKELDLSHLNPPVWDVIYKLLQKYWPVFDDKGLFIPVKDYKCSIDTGSAHLICIKKIHYELREIPIMWRCISSLKKLGLICQIHGGEWLFKALLAPKPHQEHIRHIDNFVWHFCVNYIPLNQITHPIAYPIPHCNSAVHLTFRNGRWMWMWDALQGYHQIGFKQESQEKLAFAGPDATTWTYNVMPFGPVNGPATFIAFIHNVDSTWKDVAQLHGVVINKDTNTNIIIDDIVGWAKSYHLALIYMESQLQVCQSQNLSLSLKKSQIFPKRFEFVGIDVCPNGN